MRKPATPFGPIGNTPREDPRKYSPMTPTSRLYTVLALVSLDNTCEMRDNISFGYRLVITKNHGHYRSLILTGSTANRQNNRHTSSLYNPMESEKMK